MNDDPSSMLCSRPNAIAVHPSIVNPITEIHLGPIFCTIVLIHGLRNITVRLNEAEAKLYAVELAPLLWASFGKKGDINDWRTVDVKPFIQKTVNIGTTFRLHFISGSGIFHINRKF